MNILYILDYTPLGGRAFDHYLILLAQRIHEKGGRLRFVFAGEPAKAFLDQVRNWQVEWMVLPFPLAWRFIGAVRRRWPDSLHDLVFTSFLSVFTGPVLLARMTGKIGYWVVSDESSGCAAGHGIIKRCLRFVRGRFVGYYVDAIRTVSAFVAQRDIHDMGLPAAKVHAILNGIEISRFPFAERVASDEGLRILYMGQLIAEKGVDTLIESLALLQRMGILFQCRIAGDGKIRSELQGKVDVLGLGEFINIVGFCEAPVDQYAWADVVVVPSVWAEAFGLVAIEAMATGAVVVVSDAGALPEVVGDAGVIVPSRDERVLAQVLQRLAGKGDWRQSLAREARKRVEAFFAVERTVKAIQELLENVCSGGGIPGICARRQYWPYAYNPGAQERSEK